MELGFTALGTGAALLTALVWELCGGDGALSTGTGLLSAGVGVVVLSRQMS